MLELVQFIRNFLFRRGFQRRRSLLPWIESCENRTLLSAVLVDTNANTVNAPDLTSIAALKANPGIDGISLQEAILAANNDPGADLIEFDVSLLGSTLQLTGTRMTISDDLTIDGDIDNDGRADITIDGAQSIYATRQHFDVAAGTATLYGLNLTRGRAQGSNTGGIDIRSGATLNFVNSRLADGFSYSGVAGIDNAGTLNILNSQMNDHFNYVGATAQGTAGIRNRAGATLNMASSSLSGNSRNAGAYSAKYSGIINYGSANLVNTTIADGYSVFGHVGFSNKSGATATLTHTTISRNQSLRGQGGGVRNESGATLTLVNSLVTGNYDELPFGGGQTPTDLTNAGTLNLVGGNVVGDEFSVDGVVQSSGFDVSDVITGPATDNGGLVQTVKLTGNLSNPALEAATVLTETAVGLDVDGDGTIESTPISVDARGFNRDVDIDRSGTTPDLGAFELQDLPPAFLGALSDGIETVALLENTATTTDSPVGTLVFNVDANDGDGGATDTGLTYAFVSGNTDPDGDGTFAFAIDSLTGEITVQDEDDLNLHRQSSFTLTVSATDGGLDHTTSTATVIVDIADVSETYIVTTNTLEAYDGGTLEEETADGNGLSLSEAIALANAGSAADLVEFDASLLGSTLQLTGTRMTISNDLTIDGDIDNDGRADITIDGAQSIYATRQHFDVAAGATTLYGLNLTRGRAQSNNTGGIDVRSGATLNFVNSRLTDGFSYSGVAGIDNAGTLNIRNSQINDHFNYVGATAQGTAGIRNRAGATLNMANSSLSGNSRNAGAYSAKYSGIINYGSANLVNTTIADGHSVFGHAGFSNKSGATATLTHTTISGNQSQRGPGGGVRNESGATLTLANSLVTGNYDLPSGGGQTPTDLTNAGTLNLVGGNVVGDEFSVDGVVQSSGFAPSDVIAGPAADNGGLVQTVKLTLTSTNPALDAGDDSVSVPTDSRGLARFDRPDVANNGSNIADLGAYEAGESQSLVVTTDQDIVDDRDNLTSLREALAFANDPTAGSSVNGDADNDGNSLDHITFDPSLSGSTLTLTQGELVISSDVSIDGDLNDDNSPDITIDAAGNSRVMFVRAGASELTGLTLTGGSSYTGGGIFLEANAALSLVDSQVTNNFGHFGGGITALSDSSLTLVNTQVTYNRAYLGGGGFQVNGGSLTVLNSHIMHNNSRFLAGGIQLNYAAVAQVVSSYISNNIGGSRGGGIRVEDMSSLTLNESIVAHNEGERGGGLSIIESSHVQITNSQIRSNTTTSVYSRDGAGLYISGAGTTVAINGSTIANNESAGAGGGISIRNLADVTLTNTSLLNNVASSSGGGMYASSSQVTMSGVKIRGNSAAASSGGGVEFGGPDGVLTMFGTTISGNTAATDGGGIALRDASDATIVNTTISGNRAGESGGGLFSLTAPGALTIVANTTVTGNDAPSAGGVDNQELGGLFIIANSIVAGNFDVDSQTDPLANPDMEGSQGIGAGTNLIGHGSGYALSDIFADIDLITGGGLLADNGGLVPTVALKASLSNPAINTATPGFVQDDKLDLDGDGDNTETVPFDGRGAGFPRNRGGAVDLGAFEAGEEQSLVVTTDQDVVDAFDGLTSLREALALANDTSAGANADGDADNDGDPVDHITFDPSLTGSTLTLTQGELVISSDVSIDGDIDDDSSPDITIDAVGNSRVMALNAGVSELTGLTLTGGSAGSGGGILLDDFAALSLVDSMVTNNYGFSGGGIALELNSSLSLVNTQVTYNSAYFGAAGIQAFGGSLTVRNSHLAHNNSAYQGGGIRLSLGAVAQVISSSISHNMTGSQGGGIRVEDASSLTLVDSVVAHNTARGNGGGLAIFDSSNAQITNSQILSNTTTGLGQGGGGIYINGTGTTVAINGSTIANNEADAGGGVTNFFGTLSISGSAIFENIATTEGGGIASFGTSNVNIANTTISGNRAGTIGGGIHQNSPTVSLMLVTNSTVTGNYAPSGGGVDNRDTGGGFIIANSIIAGNFDLDSQTDPDANPDFFGSQGSGDGTNLIGHGSGYALSDIFADIDPVTGGGLLADNGGLVPTVALKVSTDNPAINTADPTFVPADTLDLDGDGDTTEPIPFDARGAGFTRNFGGGVDLGAFESTGETPSLVVTTALDVIDALDGLTSLREALALANDATAGANSDGDADNDGSSVDHITFDPSLTGSTLTLTQGELVISSDVSIDGDIDDDSSPDITIDAVGTSRVLLVNSGTSLVRGMILTGGDSSNGGGMFVHRNANVHLLESTVSGNSSRTRGGGISSYGPLTITNSVIADNNTGRYGGGVYSAGALKVSGSTVSRNSSQWYGGGIDSAAGFTITNSTIEGNSAVRNGGGLSIYSSSVTAINCTITGNYSMQLHGGVFGHQFSSITMMNSIVAGNTGLLAASTAGANPDFFGKLTAGSGDNLIGYGSGYALSDIFAAIDPVTGGGLLADNGGLVPTVALKPSISNPAYNTANPTFLPSDTLDLDGDGDTTEAIPFDSRGPGFARINGGFADLGAYELSEAELNILTVQIDLASIGESGGVSNATVTRGGSMVGDLVVTLTSDDAGEASVPMTVTILDGNASASFDVTGVPDGLFDGTETVTITASAAGFDSGSDTIDVTNVDLPPDTTTPANVNLLSNGSLIIGAAGTVNNNLQITFDSNTGHYILEDIIPLNPLGGLVGNDLNPATNIIEFDPTAVGAFNNIIANLNLGNDTVTINSLRSGGPEGLDIRNDANEGDDTIHIAGPIVDAGRQLLLRSEHITLANQISTQNQAVRLEGDVTLTGNSEINAGTGAVIASGTIDGAHGLTVIAGLVQFDGDIGSTAPLTDLTASGNIVRTQNAAVTGGDVTFNANSFIPQGTISGDGNLTIRRNTAGEQNVNASDLQFITPGFASVTVGSGLTNQLLISSDGDNNLVTGSVNVGAPLTLIGQTLILGDSIQQGMGTLTLRANNTLQFTSLGSAIGTGDVMIEKLNAGGTLTVVGNFGSPTAAAPWGLNHTSVSAPGSFVDFTGGVGSGFASLTANAGSLRFNSPGAVTAQGDVSLTADDIQLNGGVFSQTGSISLTGNIDLTGNVLFKVAPGQDLIVDGGVAANGYNILVRGNGGAANQVSFLGDVVGAGSFQIDSSGASTANAVALAGISANKFIVRGNIIELSGDITSNVNVQFIGPVTLNGDVSVTSGSDATYYTQFTSTIDGGYDLAVNSGAGRAVFAGEIGGATPVANVQVTSSANNFITRNITTLGNFNWDNTGGKLTITSGRIVDAGGNIDILADVFTNLGSLVAGGTINTP